MPVFASIDVGANSVHLLVAAVVGRQLEPLTDESVKLGLGAVVDARGVLAGVERDRLVATLRAYVELARGCGAGPVVVVGTEPLRRAADARAVVAAVEASVGVPFHVLDHDEEGLLNLLGVTGGRQVEEPLAVVDIGGGSSEVVLVEPGGRARSRGLPVGSGSLSRRVVGNDPPTEAEIAALRAAAVTLVARAPAGSPRLVLAVGGTASNLLRVVPEAAFDRTLTPERFEAALATLRADRAADVAARYAITEARARSLPAGAALLEAVLAHYGLTTARVVEEGIREGVVLALARAGRGWRDRLEALAHGWAG